MKVDLRLNRKGPKNKEIMIFFSVLSLTVAHFGVLSVGYIAK